MYLIYAQYEHWGQSWLWFLGTWCSYKPSGMLPSLARQACGYFQSCRASLLFDQNLHVQLGNTCCMYERLGRSCYVEVDLPVVKCATCGLRDWPLQQHRMETVISQLYLQITVSYTVVWHSGSALVSIYKVNPCWAWLVLGWVTMSGFNSQCWTSHLYNQPSRSTQPGHLFVGMQNECQPKGGDALWLGSEGSYDSCVGGRWNSVIPLLHTTISESFRDTALLIAM